MQDNMITLNSIITELCVVVLTTYLAQVTCILISLTINHLAVSYAPMLIEWLITIGELILGY